MSTRTDEEATVELIASLSVEDKEGKGDEVKGDAGLEEAKGESEDEHTGEIKEVYRVEVEVDDNDVGHASVSSAISVGRKGVDDDGEEEEATNNSFAAASADADADAYVNDTMNGHSGGSSRVSDAFGESEATKAMHRIGEHRMFSRFSSRSSSGSGIRKGPYPYKKKDPLFYSEHKARARNLVSQHTSALMSTLKKAFTHRFRPASIGGGMDLEGMLDYRVRLGRELNDTKPDEQIQLQHMLSIIRKSEVKQKRQHLRTPRRMLKEQERLEQERKERERKLRGIVGRQPLPDFLDEEQEQIVRQTLRQPGKIAQMPGAGVESHDIRKLSPGQWLNDEVINFYMKLIERRSNVAAEKRIEGAQAKLRLKLAAYEGDDAAQKRDLSLVSEVKRHWNAIWNVHVFNSFFYEKLSKQGYAGVRQWTRKVDLFTKDLVLLPVNVGQMHWTCAVINLRQCRFEYYDSMHSRNPDVLRTLADYLTAEYADKKKGEFGELDLRGWTRYFSRLSPAQANGFDCGVFATMTIEQLTRRSPWDGPMPPALDARTVVTKSAELARQRNPALLSSDEDEDDDEDDSDEVSNFTQLEDDDGYADDEQWNFSQDNMSYLRRRMIYEIVKTELLD